MAVYRIKKVGAKTEMIEVLQSLLGQGQDFGSAEQMQREWAAINKRMAEALQDKGRDGWDFNLMNWPADVPLFNVSINRATLSTVISIDDVVDLLTQLKLPWCVRLECLDRIQGDLMVGGDDLQDAVVTRDEVYLWRSEEAK